MPRLFMSNNDVINAGHNNWLFAPGTDMDRALDQALVSSFDPYQPTAFASG
jgi:hypothetical protein